MRRVDSQEYTSGYEQHVETLLSHQLRTPLSVIKWHTELMLDGDTGHLTHEQRKYLEHILVGYQQTAVLIEELLSSLANPPLQKAGV